MSVDPLDAKCPLCGEVHRALTAFRQKHGYAMGEGDLLEASQEAGRCARLAKERKK